MTTAAERIFRPEVCGDESGQSILEFLLMLPLIVGMTVITIRVNMAIQVSIVNQKYARGQALFLAFNSPVYPSRPQQAKAGNQLVAGVTSELVPPTNGPAPHTTSIRIARNRTLAQAEPTDPESSTPTGWVRVRGTVTLCTQSNKIDGGSGLTDMNEASLGESVTPKNFAYCRGWMKDEEATP